MRHIPETKPMKWFGIKQVVMCLDERAQWSLDIVLTSRQPRSHRSQSTVTQTQADEKMIYSRHCQVIFTPRRHTGVDLALVVTSHRCCWSSALRVFILSRFPATAECKEERCYLMVLLRDESVYKYLVTYTLEIRTQLV